MYKLPPFVLSLALLLSLTAAGRATDFIVPEQSIVGADVPVPHGERS